MTKSELEITGLNVGGYQTVICLMGCTGCGKSTFCNLITGNDPRHKSIFTVGSSS